MIQSQNASNAPSSGPTSKSTRGQSKKSSAPAAEAPANAIDFGTEPASGPAAGGALSAGGPPKGERVGREKKAGKQSETPRAKPSILEARTHPVPDTVRERFIQIGNNFFFPDGAEAFTDHGDRVTTRSENAVVIQSMVAIGQARSASTVTVSGTEFFKKEAWFAARLAGLEVLGYSPTALEQERLVRAIARRRTAEKEDEAPSQDTLRARENGTPKRPQREAPAATPEAAPEKGELIVGRLVDHGPAPYQHKPKQAMSYYVRIETDRGDREIWGVDLERAFRQSLSTPGVGDEVGLRAIGRESVTVLAPKYDSTGREVAREELDTHRNQWLVERKDFLDRRFKMADLFRNASVSAVDGVKHFPELEGSYLQLQIARAGAEERIANAQAREQFVDHLRAHLAKAIEYGQPLEPVHLKARGEQAPEPQKVHDRDHAPTR